MIHVARKTKKQTRGILAAIIVLVIAVGVLAYLNRGDLDRKKELETQAEFALTYESTEHRVTMQDILALGPVDFTTVVRTSTAGPRNVTFRGVELRRVLEKYGIPINEDSTIEVMALDGYVSVIYGDEVLEEENVYITIAMDGEPLKPKSEGGSGPYYLVIRGTEFAQRWVKFMEEITVQ